jgi:hypothetical protein
METFNQTKGSIELLKDAFHILKNNPGVYLFAAFLWLATELANRGMMYLKAYVGSTHFPVSNYYNYISLIPEVIIGATLYTLTTIILISLYLNLVDRTPLTLTKIRSPKLLIKVYFTGLLYNLMVGAGTLVFIVPGIFIAIIYVFSIYFVIDTNSTIGEGFSKSALLTKGHLWVIFELLVGSFLTRNIFLFFLRPLIDVALVVLYRQLQPKLY